MFLRLACAVVACVLGSSAAAAPDNSRKLSPTEKGKVMDTLRMMEEVLKKESKWDAKLGDTLNKATDPGGAANQITYEDPNRTYGDAVRELWRMIDTDRLRADPGLPKGARTNNQKGTNADTVRVSETTLKKMCAGGVPIDRFFQKIRLAASLMNEAIHVQQVFEGLDLKQCDGEYDSDTGTIDLLCGLESIFTMAFDPSDITEEDCPVLAKCLASYGIADGNPNWETLIQNIVDYKKYYQDRRQEFFGSFLTAGNSWGKKYYGEGNYTAPVRFAGIPAPDTLVVNKNNGQQRFYQFPGKTIVKRDYDKNDLGQEVMTVVARDNNTQRLCTFVFTDTDGDCLPEPTPQTAQATTPSPGVTDNQDLFQLPMQPGDDANTGQTGWTYIDTTNGDVFFLPIDPITLAPTSPIIQQVANLLPLSDNAGGFYYLDSTFADPIFSNIAIWVFGQTPPVAGFPDQPAIQVPIDTNTNTWLPPAGIFSLAEARANNNIPDVVELEPGMMSVELIGNPGRATELLDIGNFGRFPIAGGAIGFDGLTPPLPLPLPLPPGLFEMQEPFGESTIQFEPATGENTGCAAFDETGDGFPERFQLTLDPPRLHVFLGTPVAPDMPAWAHQYELVLPDPNLLGIPLWDGTDRLLVGVPGELPLPDPFFGAGPPPILPPQLVQGDADGLADDALILVGAPLENPLYEVQLWFDVAGVGAPLLSQAIPLPPGFVPNTAVIENIDNDGHDDMRITDFNGGPDQCVLNQGGFVLTFGPCPTGCPADVNKDGVASPADFTAWLVCFQNPASQPFCPNADVNMSGTIDPADFTAWLAAFQAGCP